MLLLTWASLMPSASAQSLSRGHRILQQRGLQIQAMVVPDDEAPGISLDRFLESKFTAVNLNIFDRSADLDRYLEPADGRTLTGMWINSEDSLLNDQERRYLPSLVSLQFHDELNVAAPQVIADAREALAEWREAYPDTIGYLNHISGNSDAELRHYLAQVQPDMLMFATYPFNGQVAGGSPTELYVDLQRFRRLALGGHDGTGQQPIPFAQYLQTFTSDALLRHQPSSSEMRLNQFAGWAFGAQFATAFFYTDVPNESEFETSLFIGDGDAVPRQPAFDSVAETNRQSRNLGPALVRLKSSHVSIVRGSHPLGPNESAANLLPAGVPAWEVDDGRDAFLTHLSAANTGTANSGLGGDLIVGRFTPLQGAPNFHFMIVNGLSDPVASATETAQKIRMEFDFGGARINSLLRLSRLTGQVEVVPLQHDGGTKYHLEFELEGGTGDLFKYNDGSPFASVEHVSGGYVVSTSRSMTFVDGDGMSRDVVAQGGRVQLTSLSNGNVVGRTGADVWEVRDVSGEVVASKQLSGMGDFRGAIPLGHGGFAAVSSSHVAFMSADGQTLLNSWSHTLAEAAPLTNGNVVARMAGTDDWRLYNPTGETLTVRRLDNSGVFNAVAPLGNGGYAAVSDSRIVFMAADGRTVRRVVTDVASHVTTLRNGNIVGLVGANHWRMYSADGQTLSTRQLDGLGTFVDVAPLGHDGFLALSDRTAVFMDDDGVTVRAVVQEHLENLTLLASGNVVARVVGTDLWQMYGTSGDLLASRLLPNDGSFLGIAATGLFTSTANRLEALAAPSAALTAWNRNLGTQSGATESSGDYDADGDVDVADFLYLQRRSTAPSVALVPEPRAVVWHTLSVGVLSMLKNRFGDDGASALFQSRLH